MSESEGSGKIHLMLIRPKSESVIENLTTKQGRDFETAVYSAMDYLDLDSHLTGTTEAESDVIAEAVSAEVPYFLVIECQAVREGSQVDYDKIGQIRGNAPSYLDARRQQLFKTYYKIIVGKPEFSDNVKTRAEPDVGLLGIDALIRLVQMHEQYSLSLNMLQRIFSRMGLIDAKFVDNITRSYLGAEGYFRKLKIYSLVYAALLENPLSDKSERRKNWTSIDQVIGEVLGYSRIFRIPELNGSEVGYLIRDLDNPFFRVVESKADQVRLSTFSTVALHNFSKFGQDLEKEIWETLDTLRNLKI
jgi:hypothetical protein